MLTIRLYFLQRLTAIVMAPLVLLHLGLIIYAIQGGLSSDEILGRTQGSVFWGAVYCLFVVSVSVHGAIGLRSIAFEWGRIRGLGLNILSWGFCLITLVLGGRAVYAVVSL